MSFTIYPDTTITPYAYPDEDRVVLMLDNETIEIGFHDVNDLRRFRDAIDELIPLLTEQIAHLDAHTPPDQAMTRQRHHHHPAPAPTPAGTDR